MSLSAGGSTMIDKYFKTKSENLFVFGDSFDQLFLLLYCWSSSVDRHLDAAPNVFFHFFPIKFRGGVHPSFHVRLAVPLNINHCSILLALTYFKQHSHGVH